MFDEIIFYNVNDFDVFQLLIKSMFEKSFEISSVTSIDKIIEIKSDSNLNLMKSNKNSKDSKEKNMKISNKQRIIHLLFISKLESKRYDVEILNQ